ncbi:MAG: hypothetical protein ACLSH6_02520 [Limosilactobacillus pontis]
MKKQQHSRGWLRWVVVVILLVVSACLILISRLRNTVGSYRPTSPNSRSSRTAEESYNFSDVMT